MSDNKDDYKLKAKNIKRLLMLGGAFLNDMMRHDPKRIGLNTDTLDKVSKKFDEEDKKEFEDEWNKEFNYDKYESDHPIKARLEKIKEKIFKR